MDYRILTLALTLCATAGLLVDKPAAALSTSSTPVASGLVDDNAAGWIWRGMDEIDDSSFTGGTARAGGASAYCAYTFQGTGIQVTGLGGETVSVGSRAHKLGKAVVSIDGKAVSTVSLQRDSTEYGISLAQVTGLANGNHVLEITSTGGWIVIDCAYVSGPNSSLPTVSPSTPGTLSEGIYRLHPKHALDKCLEVATIAVDGVLIDINHTDQNRPQIWHVTALARGRFEISPVAAPGLALTLVPPSAVDGAPAAHLYNYIADPAQQLLITPSGEGYFRISPSSDSGVVLDVFKLLTVDGTQTITYKWWGADNQQWAFEPSK